MIDTECKHWVVFEGRETVGKVGRMFGSEQDARLCVLASDSDKLWTIAKFDGDKTYEIVTVRPGGWKP